MTSQSLNEITKKDDIVPAGQFTRRFLNMRGIGDVLAVRTYAHFGRSSENLEQILKLDPYLIVDVFGMSLGRADTVARAFGISSQDIRRKNAILKVILTNNTARGHTFLPFWKLRKLAKAYELVEIDSLVKELIDQQILVSKGKGNETNIYLKKYYDAEQETAEMLREYAALNLGCLAYPNHPHWRDLSDEDLKSGDGDSSGDSTEFDVDQAKAVLYAPKFSLMVITGGPGTGKSFIVNSIVKKLETTGPPRPRIALCAPTGKAAKRLSEACNGRSSFTIHRLLGASHLSVSYKYNKANKLKRYQWIIVDESSMIDVSLAHMFLSAIDPNKTNLIFVGDVNQLAPVGPGTFFKDLIKCGLFPVITLKTNHRQGRGSSIAENALKINNGSLQLEFDDDIEYIEANDPIIVREKIKDILIDVKQEYSTLEEFVSHVQFLSPQHKTIIGVSELNKLLRFWINPHARANEVFSVGDKVMQTSNDYKLKIFNGTQGVILKVYKRKYIVHFQDVGTIEYPRIQNSITPSGTNMILSYCTTVHKYQGSECDIGVIVLSSAHSWMLTRNLLYTAITRFKKRCILLGDRPAIRKAITNTREQKRYTNFNEALLTNYEELIVWRDRLMKDMKNLKEGTKK